MSNPLDVQVGGEHYKSCKIQPVEFIEANGLGFLEGCVIKRLARHEKPTGKGRQDIEKAIHELQLLLQLRYSSTAEPVTGERIQQYQPVYVTNPGRNLKERREEQGLPSVPEHVLDGWQKDKDANFRAQNADGTLYYFALPPIPHNETQTWVSWGISWVAAHDEPNPNWRNTLQERPKC